jgi:hypothetical protein
MKLTKIVEDSSVGLVEDEHVFRNLNFIKTKNRN